MNEAACQFGAHGRLSGVVTEPMHGRAKVACILVSAGLVPKFGPYRLYTLLARRLARTGVLTLRFDLGGIGDSQQEHSRLPLTGRTALEIQAATDYITERFGYKDIILCGLCSGAEDSFRYAEQDSRIRGVVMIDPFCYRTSGWSWRHLFFRLTRRFLRLLRIYRPFVYPVSGAAPPGENVGLIHYKYMEQQDAGRILATLLARRARIHFIYTGGMREAFNHPAQLQKMFSHIDFGGYVTLDHLPGMEHTQMLEEDRRAVIEAIGRWFDACKRATTTPA